MHKSVIGLIGIGVVIIIMGVVMGALKGSATSSRLDQFSVTTTSEQTTAVVGTQELPWKGLTSSVQSITSNYAVILDAADDDSILVQQIKEMIRTHRQQCKHNQKVGTKN